MSPIEYTIIRLDNCLLPDRRQAIILTNDDRGYQRLSLSLKVLVNHISNQAI